jgi:transposase
MERRQVSTRPEAVDKYFRELTQRSASVGGYVALVEVCGFNDWLLDRLPDWGCRQTILVQPEKRSRRKTDQRDANQLGELLWVNRKRLLAGQRIQGLRQVRIPTAQERDDRRLTNMRYDLGRQRTRIINQLHHILQRRNLEHGCPTRNLKTKKARAWLAQLPLDPFDRLELDQLLKRLELCEEQLGEINVRIAQRQQEHPTAAIVASLPGASGYGALAIASRVGPIGRFPRPRSLANYFGLVPGCRNSGESTQRLGGITKEGSRLVRFLLGQMVLHVLKRDAGMRAWYKRIKHRRGSKIARVAVMRRLATILWHMLSKQEAYHNGGPPRSKRIGETSGGGALGEGDIRPQVPSPKPSPPSPLPCSR